MKDMVNLLTGDFAYQIPLSNIPGPYGNYPLSLSYHAGISPQQEASWVGLGWSLNPGVINRDVRGVPDDQFHGGTLGFIYQYSAMQTWGVELGFSNGVFSVGQTFSSNGNVGYSASIGPRIAGVAGVVASSRIYSADANNIGLNLEMDAILAVALGGNALGGGKFSLAGSVIGAYTIQALTTTLYAMEVPADQLSVYKAIVVVMIVVLQSPVFKRMVSNYKIKKANKVTMEGGK